MIRSRSMPTSQRSYADELDMLQRKRAEKAAKRNPISPEGPRASEGCYVESRFPEQSKRVQNYRRPSQSEPLAPERRMPATPRREPPRGISPMMPRTDPVGATAENEQYVRKSRLATPSPSREQRLLDLEAQQKKRLHLLQQQMENQQMQMQRQMYEQQMQRQRQMLDEQRRSVSRRKSNVSRADTSRAEATRGDIARAGVTRLDAPKADTSRTDASRVNISRARVMRTDISRADVTTVGSPKVIESNLITNERRTRGRKADIYDRFTGAESTTGYSVYSDKYKTSPLAKRKPEPPDDRKELNPTEELEQVNTKMVEQLKVKSIEQKPVVIPDPTVGNIDLSKRQEIEEIVVADTCPQDFVETMFMPAGPTMEDQQMINEGVNDLAIASDNAANEDSCGVFLPSGDRVVLPEQDWYEKEEPLAKESYMADFVHSLWACR